MSHTLTIVVAATGVMTAAVKQAAKTAMVATAATAAVKQQQKLWMQP